MALKLWTGPSGSGKTRFLFEYVLSEAEKHADRNYLVIVPEQFTLSTQKELIRLSRDKGILNVDVLSFARLSYRIFEEVGFKNARGKAIDDMGKNLILRHLASKCDDELKILSGNMNKLGYITEVKSVISELMQYGVSVDKLAELSQNAVESGKKHLADKLKDIETLYRSFNEYTQEKYITREEILSRASRAAWKSKKLKNSVVVFDGYTGFTPVQYDLIEVLLQIARDIHVTILTDTRDKITYNTEHELFYLGYKTTEKLKKLAELNNVQIEKDFEIVEDVPRRYLKNNAVNGTDSITDERLVHLERNLFREYAEPFKTLDNITGDSEKPTQAVNHGIRVFTGVQPVDEVTKVAVEIKKLVKFGEIVSGSDGENGEAGDTISGIRYKNIAIATGDLDTYVPIVKRVFAEYDIPFFIDKKQPVLLNPFIEFIRAMVDLITENFAYSAVFRYLRSPLTDYDMNDIDRLENFVLKYGISGVREWKASWAEKYSRYFKKRGLESENSVDDELQKLENIRQKFISEVEELTNLITDDNEKTAKTPTKAVNEINAVFMRVFEGLDIEKRIIELVDKYSITDESFERNHKKEYEKIYSSVVELMQRMDELLDGEEISYSEYGELLDAGFDEIRIGIIPTITDYIQIGDLTRSRFENIHTLFIVGANDGIIPKNSGRGGIISDIEKEYIIETTPDIELSPTVREQTYTGQLYLYMLMTKPTHQLCISYSRLNSESESMRPSYIIKVITDMFGDIVIDNDRDSYYDRIVNLETGKSVLSDIIHEKNAKDLLKVIVATDQEAKESLLKIIDAAFMTGSLRANDKISQAVAQALYGKAVIGSVTRLERYARCSFNYFLQYGLSLKEREIFSFEAKDMGNIFHSVLEKYSGYLNRNNISWTDISDDDRTEIVKRIVTECVQSPEYMILGSSARYRYMIERILRISLRSVRVLTEHLRSGSFIPKDAEISFSSSDRIDAFTFRLSDDEIMKLTGKIDRLDVCTDEENEKVYIKVIDYKSGNKSFDLVEVYKGLSLQLVVYMNAAMEIVKQMPENEGREVLPAGILYYHIEDPLVDGELSDTNEDISGRIFRELKMKGLVSDDREVIGLIDGGFEKTSDIIPVSYTSKGDFTKNSAVLSQEGFDVLSQYVNRKIEEIGKEIMSGNIKAEPHTAKGVDTSGCEYCQYSDICRFDGNHIQVDVSNTVTKENVIELMREDV